MIYFMLDDDGEEASRTHFLRQTPLILVADRDLGRSDNWEELSRQAETSLSKNYFFLRRGGDIRIDEENHFAIRLGDRQAERLADLRRSQTDALFSVHRFDHLRQKRLDFFH